MAKDKWVEIELDGELIGFNAKLVTGATYKGGKIELAVADSDMWAIIPLRTAKMIFAEIKEAIDDQEG